MRLEKIWHSLRAYVCRHKIRTAAGLIFMVAELIFFLGTGCLLEGETHLLSGEGSWRLQLTADNPVIYQEFVPSYAYLDSLSFCMYMSDMADLDGTATLYLTDGSGQKLFEKSMSYMDMEDGSFTDVDIDLELSNKEKYYMVISCTPSSAGEYPSIAVCSKDYKLPESRTLVYGEEIEGQHLVSRYKYEDVLTASRVFKAVILSFLAAAGIIFGIPDNANVRKSAAIIIWIAAPFMLGQRLELLNHNPSLYLPFAMWWNIGIIYMLELIVLLATHSPRFSVVITNTAVTLLYSANYFMVMYRGTALRMNDFTAIRTAAKVVDGYDLTPNSRLAFIWGLLIVFVIFVMQTNIIRDEPGKITVKFVISYICTSMLAVLMLLYGGNRLLYSDFLAKAGFEGLIGFDGADVDGFAYELMYYYDGYLAATCIEIQNSRIVKPEGYSEEKVEELLSEFADIGSVSGDEELPHVIMIMNESFSDLHVIGDVELSQEPLKFFNSLQDNTVRGWVNASTFGGGTANSEFEVFTGCSMAFLSVNYYPYQQALNREVPSMVSHMKDNGYTAISMHPESADNWNRKNIYKYYGFDTMLWNEDFEGCEIVHSGVSDAETYRRVIDLYESREQNEKLFIFDLTMQNHGGYTEDESPYAVTVENVEEEQLDQFLSLTKISDEAFEELVHYFEEQDEKVIICMFGDHQPWIFELAANSEITKGQTPSDKIMNKYKTPFVIWANYDIEEEDGLDISMNYLGGLIMRTAGVPLSPYFTFLERQRTEYPIISVNGYVDDKGEYSSWSSGAGEFPEYRILQYNYLFDSDMVEWGY